MSNSLSSKFLFAFLESPDSTGGLKITNYIVQMAERGKSGRSVVSFVCVVLSVKWHVAYRFCRRLLGERYVVCCQFLAARSELSLPSQSKESHWRV